MKKHLLNLTMAALSLTASAQVSQWTQFSPPVAGRTFNEFTYVKHNSITQERTVFTAGFTPHSISGSGPNTQVNPSFTEPRFKYGPNNFTAVANGTTFRCFGAEYITDTNFGQYNDESWMVGDAHAGGIGANYTTGVIRRRPGAPVGTGGFTDVKFSAGMGYLDITSNKTLGGEVVCAVGNTRPVSSNVLISTTSNNGANWTDAFVNVTNGPAQLNSVHFGSLDVVYAVGSMTDPVDGAVALVLKSSDQGANWTELSIGLQGIGALNEVFATDASNVWAVGNNGIIVHSVDGGGTWTAQSSGTEQHLHGIFFLDNDNGWACGNAGTIRMTADGGQTWASSAIGTTANLTHVAFVEAGDGLVQTAGGEIFSYTPCEPSFGVDVRTACTSLTWIDGNTYTEANNTATHYLIGANGCDSIVTLNLTMVSTPVTGTAVVESPCVSYTWIDGITYTSGNSTATYTFEGGSYTGCDSIVTLNLTLLGTEAITGTATAYLCPNSPLIIGGQTITQTGDYTEVLISTLGCDSTVTWTVVEGGEGNCFEWEHVPGARLTNISCGSVSRVVGIATSGRTWIVNSNTGQLSQQAQNNLQQISVSADGTVWGFGPGHGSNNNLWRSTGFNGTMMGSFSPMTGFLSSIATSSTSMAFGHSGSTMYRFNGGSWLVHSSSGFINQVSSGPDNALWGKDQFGNARWWNGSFWTTESGTDVFSWIAVGDANKVAGIVQGQLYLRLNGSFVLCQTPNPNGSQLIQVDVASDGTVYILTDEATNNVYRSTWNDLLCTVDLQPTLTYDETTMTLSGSSLYSGYLLTLDGQEVASGPGSSFTYNVTQGGAYMVEFGAVASTGLGNVVLSESGSTLTIASIENATLPIQANISWTGFAGVSGTWTALPHNYSSMSPETYTINMTDANGVAGSISFPFPLPQNPMTLSAGGQGGASLACPATASVSVVLDPVSIAEAGNDGFRMYPNPATSSVTLDGLTIGSTITLMDAMGRMVGSYAANAGRMELGLSGLGNGIYLVQVMDGSSVRTARLIVN